MEDDLNMVMLSWLAFGITVFVIFTLVMRHYFPPDTR
jgi:hypothetical protein